MSDAGAKYRPEIDGLRAIAIVAVVAYHVGVPAAPGGFVGVDVFFVISGFLITGLLLDEYRSHGSIDLLAFYARRVRRLLPAFVIVVLTTLLLGLYFLLPVREEQSNLARSAIHAAVYASNVFFARHSGGYFDGPADLLPLLHTWSLSVEEQFYLAYHASKDFNSARRCHQHPPFAGLRPREECTVSEGGQKRFVLLWGDSHADHTCPFSKQRCSTRGSASFSVR